MYSGQLLKIKKIMPKDTFDGVRVCAVDNFQGEENDIIILSLVCSNAKKRIGFLKETNRLCVALSRAKMGLYVIGNFSLMKEEGGKEWVNIIEDMEKRGLVGDALPLYCSVHDKTTLVSSGDDFYKFQREGALRYVVSGCRAVILVPERVIQPVWIIQRASAKRNVTKN